MPSINYNEGKPRPSLILRDMQSAFNEVLKVRENGSVKYTRLNFKESIGTPEAQAFLDDNLDSVERHILAIERGEKLDHESGLSHWAHVACRAMFALEYE